jgi:hypothetical protein
MEGVCDWLRRLEVMSEAAATTVKTAHMLAEELQNGVILAQVGIKLHPSYTKSSVVGRPSFDVDRRRNVKIFLDCYGKKFKFSTANFNPQGRDSPSFKNYS